jgi:hypothetical protein
MPTTAHGRYDREATGLGAILPTGPRLVVIGSTSFWHPESERTCITVGRLLAAIPDLVLITGGVEGVGETTGRSFFQARAEAGREPRVWHVLPRGEPAWDYGETHFAGSDMAERREVLAHLAGVYLAVEGGPGTVHEAAVAVGRGAVVIPVGRSGGHAAELYSRMSRPAMVGEHAWAVLGTPAAAPEQAAEAACGAVRACLASVG